MSDSQGSLAYLHDPGPDLLFGCVELHIAFEYKYRKHSETKLIHDNLLCTRYTHYSEIDDNNYES